MTGKETYNNLKQELLTINESLSSMLSDVQSRPDIAEKRFGSWKKSCDEMYQIISEEVVRVAVIGAVKSGKSTFVNSLFKGDYLKRGAGVVTSIVTRIRTGEGLKAALFFKTWDDINTEIENALFMLPTWERKKDDKPFDIRRGRDRRELQSAIDRLSEDLLITDGIRNTDFILLSLYLKGYDTVCDIISADSTTTEYSGDRFSEHRTFVSDDALAVYLRDIELEINDGDIERSVEIADCQGSDSPNPLHLAMIQDYLVRTHFIVYVISSRTGLRQADIRFLSIIKKMGILENILFVVNIDFSEHESKDDLLALVAKVKEELALVRPDPEVFTFSALYNLFNSISGNLKQKDKHRLEYWKDEKELVDLAGKEKKRFEQALNEKLTKERFSLLLSNQLERMDVMVSGIERWVKMNEELLEKDVKGAKSAIKKMGHMQKRMKQIKSLMKNTFRGATSDILKDLKSDVDRFFNVHPGSVLEQTSEFVSQYNAAPEKHREKLETTSFNNTLYVVFQEFKQALDAFMAETINPEIARFSNEIENRIKNSMEAIAGPYQMMASDDIAELKAVVDTSEGDGSANVGDNQALLDLDAIKRIAGLKLPSSTATLQYYSKVKTEAYIRLGIYSVKKLFKKALKKAPEDEREEQMHALADGIKLIKRETEKSITFHFENYRENFKFQYVSRLLQAASEHLHQLLVERFESFNTDIKAMEKRVEKKGSDREELINYLDKLADEIQKMQDSIDKTRTAIDKVS